MPFLEIGGNTFLIQVQGAVERKPTYLGQIRRGGENNALVSLRSPKREYAFVTKPFTLDEESAFRAAVGVVGVSKLVTGDAISNVGGSVTGIIIIEDINYISDGGTSFLREITFSIIEE